MEPAKDHGQGEDEEDEEEDEDEEEGEKEEEHRWKCPRTELHRVAVASRRAVDSVASPFARQLCARRKNTQNIQKVQCRKRRVATPNRATPINSFVTKTPPN